VVEGLLFDKVLQAHLFCKVFHWWYEAELRIRKIKKLEIKSVIPPAIRSHGNHFWGLPPALCSHGVSLLGNLVFLETAKSDPR
jgi:hypothetical protein